MRMPRMRLPLATEPEYVGPTVEYIYILVDEQRAITYANKLW